MIELMVVVGLDGTFELVEDDGQGQYMEKINFRRTRISFRQLAGELHIGPTSGGDISPHTRKWSVRFLGYSSSEHIQVIADGEKKIINGEKVSNGLLVDLGSHPDNVRVVVKLEGYPALNVNQPWIQIVEFLRGAQIELDLKSSILGIVGSSKSILLQIGDLHTLGLHDAVLNPVLEFLLADSRILSAKDNQETGFVVIDR